MKKQVNVSKKLMLVVVGIILIVVGIFIFLFLKQMDNSNHNLDIDMDDSIIKPSPKKEVSIVDLNSKERPYAVMINNHKEARPQSGLDKAYIVYEMMVEGGITRMMALYTSDVDVDKIGSIRSSRHYYLDYAMENDAIYVHWGYSNYAKNDISKLKINNVNGLTYGDTYFTTDKSLNRSLEHTRFTSSSLIKNAISNLGYRTERSNDYLLSYTTDDLDLSVIEGSIVANNIDIKYSNYQTSSYIYNEEEKMYYRSMNGEKHVDLVTGDEYKFKNIIIYSVNYSTISSKGHQDISNVGNGSGYYVTNGKAVPITWQKTSRESQTVYSYLNGEEIKVSDGNTFIQIYPTNGKATIY